MNASSFTTLELIKSIESNELAEARKILSRAFNRRDTDLSSTIGALRVTALQFAAWRGWHDIMIGLRELGADVNVADKLGRCPLYYAANQGHAEIAKWLVQQGAILDNPVEINSCTRDAFRAGTNQNHSDNLVIGKNLPMPECWGRTPLHQAVRSNHPEVVKILVAAGARIDVKDKRDVTPLLLAGSNVNCNDSKELDKFAEVVDILVSGSVSTNVIHPDTGSSALHHAATLGSATATRRLLEGGAWPLLQCSSTGSTAMHLAAAAGSLETLVVLLEAVNPDHIDTQDDVGRTPLHRAAYQERRECVELLVNYNGNLGAKTKTGISVIDAIFIHIPRPLTFVRELLDINIDFGVLAPKGQLQMAVVTALIGATTNMEQLAILQHPLVETFLTLKWSRLRGFFFLLVLVHVLFVISLSCYAIVLLRNNEDFTLPRHVLMLCSWILLTHNTIQVLMVPRYYLRQFETWSSLICASISLVTTTLAGNKIDEIASNNYTRVESSQWIFHSISVAILFAWIQLMLLVGRFPTYGYYALMFSTVLKNVLKVHLAFVFMIIGFALSFSVLFHGNDQFRDFFRALVKTVVMMMGEYEYGDLFNDDNCPYQFQSTANTTMIEGDENFLRVTSRIVFLGFVVLASIVLMNLMIGLAVNDIQELEKEGHIRRLLKQAEFVAHLERVMSHRVFRSKWLHTRLRIMADTRRCIVTKITIDCTGKYPQQSRDISPQLLEALFSLASKNSDRNDVTGRKIDDKNLSAILLNLERILRQLQNRDIDDCRSSLNFTKSLLKRNAARRISSTNV